jgi:hypothetical protein
MAARLLRDGMYSSAMFASVMGDKNLRGDLDQFSNSATRDDFNKFVDENYDSSADYWKLVKREDGTYGTVFDGNHSLVDENGNVLIRSALDEFDEATGQITGRKIATKNSYLRSLGMLMGMYADFNQGSIDLDAQFAAYNNFVDGVLSANAGVDKENRARIEKLLTDSGFLWNEKEGFVSSSLDSSVTVNPYLMTYKNLSVYGLDSFYRNGEAYNAMRVSDIYDRTIDVLDWRNTSGNADLIMIENMIPEGGRLKAGTIAINAIGRVIMTGMGSTMPDPTRMGQDSLDARDKNRGDKVLGAIADGKYAFNVKDEPVGDDWTKNNITKIIKLKERDNIAGYYYNNSGNIVNTTVWGINAHQSNNNPMAYVESSKRTGASDGCIIWYPETFKQILNYNYSNINYGSLTIRRDLFGDGTGGKNKYKIK